MSNLSRRDEKRLQRTYAMLRVLALKPLSVYQLWKRVREELTEDIKYPAILRYVGWLEKHRLIRRTTRIRGKRRAKIYEVTNRGLIRAWKAGLSDVGFLKCIYERSEVPALIHLTKTMNEDFIANVLKSATLAARNQVELNYYFNEMIGERHNFEYYDDLLLREIEKWILWIFMGREEDMLKLKGILDRKTYEGSRKILLERLRWIEQQVEEHNRQREEIKRKMELIDKLYEFSRLC